VCYDLGGFFLKVFRGWRDTTRKLWKAAEKLKLSISVKALATFAGSVLQSVLHLLDYLL
jgi:uncharacterized damage-inducible protein DinB